jgi:uncharacterized protein with von Willebrand factor type A (vWA) domain
LNDLSALSRSLGDLAKRYLEAGHEESARGTLQMGLRLGQRLADEPFGLKTETQQLLGLAMQRRLLETMDQASPSESAGQTVKERLDELARRRAEIKQFSDPDAWGGYLLKTLSEQDLITFFERVHNFGEVEARRWAASRQGR